MNSHLYFTLDNQFFNQQVIGPFIAVSDSMESEKNLSSKGLLIKNNLAFGLQSFWPRSVAIGVY